MHHLAVSTTPGRERERSRSRSFAISEREQLLFFLTTTGLQHTYLSQSGTLNYVLDVLRARSIIFGKALLHCDDARHRHAVDSREVAQRHDALGEELKATKVLCAAGPEHRAEQTCALAAHRRKSLPRGVIDGSARGGCIDPIAQRQQRRLHGGETCHRRRSTRRWWRGHGLGHERHGRRVGRKGCPIGDVASPLPRTVTAGALAGAVSGAASTGAARCAAEAAASSS